MWIGGDTNLPDINWKSDTIDSHQYLANINQSFIDVFNDIGCQQMVDFPTRQGNILDIFATNRPSLVAKSSALPGLSDHDIVLIDTNIVAQRRRPVRRIIYLWSKANLPAMEQELTEFSEEFQQQHEAEMPTINTLWMKFKSKCINTIQTHVPSKYTSTRFSQPWCNRKIRRLSRHKKRAHRAAKRSQKSDDWGRFKKIQQENRKTCKTSYNKYINNMISEDSNNKKLYSYIKSKKSDGTGISPLRDGGTLHSSPKEKAEILNNQFSSVFTNEDSSNIPDLGESPYTTAPDITVTEKGVRKLLDGLNPNKASGPDQISSRFLKSMSAAVAPILTIIFQASIDQGKVPDDWKLAFVTPLFKKGDRAKASNYRPVSLTSVCCKLIEHIIHSQVISHLERHNILADEQHGFRKKRSCESQLINTVHGLAKGLNSKQRTDAVLLDFSKAFDKVPHHRLALKLQHYGVRGKTLESIRSFLADRTQQVVVEGETSRPANVSSGVPQGTVLGPLLFLVYINDLPLRVNSTSRLFADDCMLYRTINSEADTKTLQEDLDNLQGWERDWMMSFNPDKCEVIRITNKRRIINSQYTIHGQQLQETNQAKYLGVTIDNKLTWGPHINAMTKKAKNTTAFLGRNIASCPRNIKELSYKSLVRPQVEYASTVLDNSNKTHQAAVEGVQRRAARFIMGNYRRESSVTTMLEQLQLESLQARRQRARVTMMYRVVNGLIDISSAPLQPTDATTRGHTQRFLQPFCHIRSYQDSFFPATINLWNSLPQHIVDADSLETFKVRISEWTTP